MRCPPIMNEPNPPNSQSPSAILCIIGDEILCGRTQDANGFYMARRLDEAGVSVTGISVIPDQLDVVADFLRRESPRCDYLFTSGGIGPTHDDVTRQAVAVATGRRLVMHPEAERILRDYFGERLTPARLEMARLPEGAELILNPICAVPGCIVGNIHVLPGIPSMLEVMFDSILARINGRPQARAEIRTSAFEGDFAHWLGEMCRAFPHVKIGSYPHLGDSQVRTVITLRSADADAVDRLRGAIETKLAQSDRPGPVYEDQP